MAIRLAVKTMAAIHHSMVADQGAAFRQWEGKVLPHLDDAYRGEDEPFRGHLGASLLGNECGRALWYNFRWATRPHFNAQTLRLFNRGHLEEGRFIALLLSIGMQVFQQDERGKQFRISFASGHAGGSGDGFALGCPDLGPTVYCGLEFKTHNQKSFDELAGENFRKWFHHQVGFVPAPREQFTGKGVRTAKTDHYVQMQTYMRKFNMPVCLYGATNKNTDDIYMELVELETATADQFIDRGERVVWMHEPPKQINPSPGYFGCKWCDHLKVCKHGAAPDRNCRTCVFSEPVATEDNSGMWVCKVSGLGNVPIDRKTQIAGCEKYQQKKM